MAHIKTPDNSQSVCTETNEFDVILSGDDLGPTDWCRGCNAAEPEWEIISDEEFLRRWPLDL